MMCGYQTSGPMSIGIEQQGDVCVLRCRGRFASGPELDYMQARMEDIKSLSCAKLLADFREVPSIGSMGVAFLVGVYTTVIRKPGGRFVLAGARPLVRQVLELTRLNTIIPLAPDFAAGLEALRG